MILQMQATIMVACIFVCGERLHYQAIKDTFPISILRKYRDNGISQTGNR